MKKIKFFPFFLAAIIALPGITSLPGCKKHNGQYPRPPEVPDFIYSTLFIAKINNSSTLTNTNEDPVRLILTYRH